MTDKSRTEIIEQLQQVQHIGPAFAEQLYDRFDVRSFEDVIDAAACGELIDLQGVGEAKQDEIKQSARGILERKGRNAGGNEREEIEIKTDEPQLLPIEIEYELPDYEVETTENPYDHQTLSDLGVAIELDGFGQLENDVLLRVPVETSQLVGIEGDSIRMFEVDREEDRLTPIWNSGFNPEENFVWARVCREGVYVPIGLPRDRYLYSMLQHLAKKRRQATRTGKENEESKNLTQETIGRIPDVEPAELTKLRRHLTRAELQSSSIDPAPHQIRVGNDGIPEPFPYPQDADPEEFRERIEYLDPPAEGLPEEKLFLPPEKIDRVTDLWPTNPDYPNPTPTPDPVGGIPLPDPWPPEPPVPPRRPDIPFPEPPFFEIPRPLLPPNLSCLIQGDDWYMYHRDKEHSGYDASCSSIRSSNASKLKRIHNIRLDGSIISIPTVVDGKVYVGTADSSRSNRYGTVYKYDLSTGNKDAEFPITNQPGQVSTRTGPGPIEGANQIGADGVASSPTVSDGKVYVSALTGILYCLDAGSLACLWFTDLRKRHMVKNQPIEHPSGKLANGWSSPLVVNNRVYVGMGEGEDDTHGFVYCLDANNGQVNWIFCTNKFTNPNSAGNENKPNVLPPSLCPSTVPSPFTKATSDPPDAGASPWSHCSYDANLDRIYVGTGNSRPFDAAREPRYANGILSLDASSGQFKGYFQPPVSSNYKPNQDTDVDVPAGPMLFTRNGKRLVAFGSKNGSFFLLDANTMNVDTQRQLLPYQQNGQPFPNVDPGGGENKSGVMATAAVNNAEQKIYVGLGGYGSGAIDSQTTPFMRALDWNSLNDAWPTSGSNPPKYTNSQPPMYSTPGEAGMCSPATTNDVVIMGTTANGLYVFDAASGNHLRTLRSGSSPKYSGTMGPAIYKDYVVAGFEDNKLQVFKLQP